MTKYKRQIRSARLSIARKGTLCTWYKPGAADHTDPTPEFPELADAQEYTDVPIAFFPVNRLSQGTIVYDEKTQSGTEHLYALIPGDVKFVPEENDAVVINGSMTHVNYVNTTQPDGVPIVYEVGFK